MGRGALRKVPAAAEKGDLAGRPGPAGSQVRLGVCGWAFQGPLGESEPGASRLAEARLGFPAPLLQRAWRFLAS